jgi:hypothetical protein
MIETAAVISVRGEVLLWHAPPGRSAVAIPDTRALWDVLWTHREAVAGVAHSHPGWGPPTPSWEDLTTFGALEAGLGLRLSWWIATAGAVRRYRWLGPAPTDFTPRLPVGPTPWLHELRARSVCPVL